MNVNLKVKLRKIKKSVAMPRISTKEAVIISSIEPSMKEDSFKIEKILLEQAKKDLESDKKQELIQKDNAQQNIPQLQIAYQVNEIVLDSNLDKFSIQSVDQKEAQINLLEKIVHLNLDQLTLEKEEQLKIIKELDQQASKEIIAQQPITIDQNKNLENLSEFEVEKKKKVKAKRDLSECRLESINVTSSIVDDKEQQFKLTKLDNQQANMSLTLNNRTLSHTEICSLENESTYETVKLDLNKVSTSLDFHKPLEVGIVLTNEQDGKFESETLNKKQSEIKQDALNLVTADSVCVQSEFMRSPKTGKF